MQVFLSVAENCTLPVFHQNMPVDVSPVTLKNSII